MDRATERYGALFRALRVLRRGAIWSALILVALILFAFAINSFDEKPSPQALAMLHPPENHLKADNLFVSLAGFDAPASQSVISVGQARIDQYNARVDTMLRDPLSGLGAAGDSDSQRLKFEGPVDFCRPRNALFWQCVHANGPQIEQLIEQNRELYQRYLALFNSLGYFDTARPSPAAPIYMVPIEVRDLFLASVSWRMQSGDAAQLQVALKALRQDIDLWHRMLTGEGALISKMLAISFLQTDSLILTDMIADPRATIPQNMDEYLPQIDPSDWNIGNALAGEFRLRAFIYRQTQFGPIEGHFFKINATENLDAYVMNELAKFAALNPSTFAMDQARLKKWEQTNSNLVSVRTIYNPIGKMFVSMSAPAYENYILRPYDAEALQRLARLCLEIRRQRIALLKIPEFMHLRPEWSTHPADGRSFVWKQATGEIAIQPVARQSTGRRLSGRTWSDSAS